VSGRTLAPGYSADGVWLLKRVYIETYGCQMNVADSALIGHVLGEAGYQVTDDVSAANLILVNTCAVREKAEEKVVHRLQSLARLKRSRPGLVLGLTGCVPKHLGEELLERVPGLDLLIGPIPTAGCPTWWRRRPPAPRSTFVSTTRRIIRASIRCRWKGSTPLCR